MNDLEFTIKKIESLAHKDPTKNMYEYLFGWLHDWAKEGKWFARLFKVNQLDKHPIYRAVVITLGKIATETALHKLKEFYQPNKNDDDRTQITKATIAFFNKQFWQQNIDTIDFEASPDTINIFEHTDDAATVEYQRVLRKDLIIPFQITLHKYGGMWVVDSLNQGHDS